jgi:hypothetical protein
MPFASNPLFEEAFKKKYELMQQDADTRAREVDAKIREMESRIALERERPGYEAAQAEYLRGRNPTELAIAGLHYGPGGAIDRSNLASERMRTYEVDAQRPAWTGQAALSEAQARNYKQLAGFQEKLNPSLLESSIMNNQYNTALIDMLMKRMKPVAKPRRPDWYTGKMTTAEEQEWPTTTTFAGMPLRFKPFRYLADLAEQPRRLLFAND